MDYFQWLRNHLNCEINSFDFILQTSWWIDIATNDTVSSCTWFVFSIHLLYYSWFFFFFLLAFAAYSSFKWCNDASKYAYTMCTMSSLSVVILSWLFKIDHISLRNLVIKSNKNWPCPPEKHRSIDDKFCISKESLSTWCLTCVKLEFGNKRLLYEPAFHHFYKFAIFMSSFFERKNLVDFSIWRDVLTFHRRHVMIFFLSQLCVHSCKWIKSI